MSVWFVVPAHRREELTRMCLGALRWTCEEVGAQAVVVAEDENLRTAASLDMIPLRRPNVPLGSKWNDGFQYACEHGAEYVIPIGSDDWIDPMLVMQMVNRYEDTGDDNRIICVRRSAAINPAGDELVELEIPYAGGDGVRLFPRRILATVDFRPAADERNRAIDGSIQDQLRAKTRFRFDYVDVHALQIVDFKSDDVQLTQYRKLAAAYGVTRHKDPWAQLRAWYPEDLVASAEGSYGLVAA